MDKAIELIEESGAKWIREDFFWARVETSKGVYKMPDQYVGWINRLHEKGIGIAALFNTGHQGNKLYENPFDREAFAKAAAWFAKETKGKVEVIEILNEPNNSLFMKHFGGVWNGKERDGGVSPWIREYVGFVNLAAKQIKQVNPHVKVIGGGEGPCQRLIAASSWALLLRWMGLPGMLIVRLECRNHPLCVHGEHPETGWSGGG